MKIYAQMNSFKCYGAVESYGIACLNPSLVSDIKFTGRLTTGIIL